MDLQIVRLYYYSTSILKMNGHTLKATLVFDLTTWCTHQSSLLTLFCSIKSKLPMNLSLTNTNITTMYRPNNMSLKNLETCNECRRKDGRTVAISQFSNPLTMFASWRGRNLWDFHNGQPFHGTCFPVLRFYEGILRDFLFSMRISQWKTLFQICFSSCRLTKVHIYEPSLSSSGITIPDSQFGSPRWLLLS